MLFKKKTQSGSVRYGCDRCRTHGAKRDSFRKANNDAVNHGQRVHGDPGAAGVYVEGCD